MVTQNANTKNIPFSKYTADNMIKKADDLYKMFWIFMIGSVVGFIVETIWCLIRSGRIESRSSMILAPFTAIYGIGALVLYFGNRFLTNRREREQNNILHIFIFGATASTVVEYVCSLFQETLFGSVSWDYSSQPFNIGGRVSLMYSVFWGLLALLWFVVIQPVFEKLISKIPARIYKPLTRWLAVFFVINVVISVAAVMRWGMRLDGIPSANIIAEILDKLFTNEFMAKIYPNMIW